MLKTPADQSRRGTGSKNCSVNIYYTEGMVKIMEVHEFIQKLEEVMGYKVKIKFTHTTKGDTWELTVKGKDEGEVIPIIKRIDREMRDFIKEREAENAEP